MAHSLILGMTESGKTSLAKSLAAKYKSQGFGILVLDPLRDPGWNADFITGDSEEFLSVFWSSRSCMVFIDEGGEAVGQFDKAMHKTGTRGRHWGHSVHFISQGGTQIAKIVRNQCKHLFLFCTALEDCKIHAKEWNSPEILDASKFRQGEFIHCQRFGESKKHQLF